MRSKILGLLAVGLLAGPMSANAAAVTWDFIGQITGVTNRPSATDPPAFVAPGAPYQLSLTFDPANFSLTQTNPITNPPCRALGQVSGCATRYAGNATGVLQMSLDFGEDCNPGQGGDQPCGPSGAFQFDRIFKFDDFNDGANAPYDGLRFVILDYDVDANGNDIFNGRWLFTLRGPTDIFSSPVGIPSTLDSRFAYQNFEFCGGQNNQDAFSDCESDALRVTGSRVPEPGSLALLGLGLAGLGLSRRRKA